ncbi:MAG: ketoacyl-ACP synthase III [Clostridium sp.]|nr:ketoacyl-ACP synthase III [Clostridium sp.]
MKIIGTGSYLPNGIVNNDDLAKIVDTSDEWIYTRTGIKERRISTGMENSEMAIEAARHALNNSGIDKEQIDLIIVATVSSDYATPSLACIVQGALEIPDAVAFDINAACSGFIYALNTAYCYMNTGGIRNALVIGSETLSKITDYEDRSTCVLFGDAAGAVVIQADRDALYHCKIGTDGSKAQVIHCKQAPLSNILVKKDSKLGYIHMDGQEVYKFVLRVIPNLIKKVVKEANLGMKDISYFILHQSNLRMNEAIAKKLRQGIEKFPCNLEGTGNTSSASVPVLLDEVNKQGKLNKGDKIVLCSFGGGLTWAAIVLEW